ncbi:MAG: hypothetical protein QNJ70_08645 [Xenococcaceae cyanobacterium MO_207.B15]|nr:hypothetical protein [Xenococcaceae cyanobacterium MO_207.B15]MDJ0741929.1 hypothetical protein [Xenococcaceae cyanobacterium MO_167.B27]
MTVENLEANGTQTQEENKEENKADNQEQKTLALSVHQKTLLPNNRPVEPSHLQIVSTYSSVGSARPVTKGDIKISNTMVISGNRPIALSNLQISETYVVMGNRPVASNEIDDPSTLMGYLD